MMRRNQLGFTLTELMISTALGLVVIAGGLQILFSTKNNTEFQAAFTRLQDNGRIAERLLNRYLRMAGYCSTVEDQAACDALFAAPNLAISGTEGGGVLPDTLTIAIQRNGSGITQDCEGNPVGAATSITFEYSIQATDADGNDIGFAIDPTFQYALYCSSTRDEQGVAVVDGVENLQVLYGISDVSNGQVSRFVPANAVADWDNVSAVSLNFLVNSVTETNEVSNRTFNMQGTQINTNDGRLRFQYDMTVQIRNRVI